MEKWEKIIEVSRNNEGFACLSEQKIRNIVMCALASTRLKQRNKKWRSMKTAPRNGKQILVRRFHTPPDKYSYEVVKFTTLHAPSGELTSVEYPGWETSDGKKFNDFNFEKWFPIQGE